MRNTSLVTVVAAAICLFTTSANAQYRNDDRRYSGYSDDRYRGGREPLDRVRTDLERAARDMRYLSRDDMKRIGKVRDEIGEFQRKWERGRFDRGELDDVINSLQKVVGRNRLHPRDRDLLLNDLAQLRDFRSRKGVYR